MERRSDRRRATPGRRCALSVALLAGAIAGHLACGKVGAAVPERYNILFIISDQHNARALGCYGEDRIRTPHLDRLAAQGVRFSNAFCPIGMCAPSRYSIWTGRNPRSHGLRRNGDPENLDETTFPEVLHRAGFLTASFGKHHMIHPPEEHGFDVSAGMPEYNDFVAERSDKAWYESITWEPDMGADDPVPVGRTSFENRLHTSSYFADRAIEFLQDSADRPFCLWLSFYGPHGPLVPSPPWDDLYDPEELELPPNFDYDTRSSSAKLGEARQRFATLSAEQHRRILARYYGLVSQIDHNLGRVLAELERLGLADRTLVIYTSDHGEMMAEHGLWMKQKLCYDATTRVPLLVRLPGTQPARVVDELVGLIDLMPTVLGVTGLAIPDDVEGRSLLPLLRSEPVAWRDVIFAEIGMEGSANGITSMARSREHKYIASDSLRHGPEQQLFDLGKDPWETRNEIANPEYRETAGALREALAEWRRGILRATFAEVEPPPPRGE